MTLNKQIFDLNKQLSKEKSTVSSLLEEKKKLKSDFKTREDELLDKQIQLEKKIKELNNILVKTGQSIQTIHMLSPMPDSFYHTEQKMALGYQNPFYLKQAQKKQQSLYDGKMLLEKQDPRVVHDSEETLQLAQESREKMKQMNKEIKPANYTKINHLSGVFVPQTDKSHKELYFLNVSKTANVSKSISIPNDDFSDDTTPSVACKFLNETKDLHTADYTQLYDFLKYNQKEIRCYNYRGVGHYARNYTVRLRRRDAAYLQTQLLFAQKEEAGIKVQAKEYDLMADAADLDEIEEVNPNFILMANLQQVSTSGTQTDSAPVYDTDGSAKVHENCDDNKIFNMFTQEEQYTKLLEPIPE
nr:hypothetical protein [Tanacetum cinerariifolium]